MENCVFCQIVKGEIPCYKVYEDENFLGFLDVRPLNPGNSLLIPKKHYRWTYDVSNFGEYWEAAKKVALLSLKVVKASSVNFYTIGEEVFHAHIRIIPRFPNDGHVNGINLSEIKQISQKDMKRIAQTIFQEIKNSKKS